MGATPKGSLVMVGGHEWGRRDERVLGAVCGKAQGDDGTLLVVTVGTGEAAEQAEEYRRLFRDAGVGRVEHLHVRARQDGMEDEAVAKVERATALFFAEGDQRRIASQVGDSRAFRCMRERHAGGLTIAGTSAGAAVLPEVMLAGGPDDESHRASTLAMAPGLGFIAGVVVDSHFAERGRIGRLLGAVAQNPKNIGLGIDEDTAAVVEPDGRLCVVGSGAVYVLDGTGITYSSLSEEQPEGVVTILGIRLHVLASGEGFDLARGRPVLAGA